MILNTFSEIWTTIVNGSLKNIYSFLTSYLVTTYDINTNPPQVIHTGVISDFIADLRGENLPTLVDNMLKAIDRLLVAVIPPDLTIFALMVGSALTLFIVITVVKWIIGIVT